MMHPENMISDARYAHSRIFELDARRRLAAQATADRAPRHGLRFQLGAALIAAGGRLQGIAPTLPEPTLAPRPAR
jgi:hypothetical protein